MTRSGDRTFGKLRISKKDTLMWLFLVMLTLPHMNPPYLERFPFWEFILNGWRLGSFAVILFWIFISRKRLSLVAILICVWEIFLFLTTVLHRGGQYDAATSAFSVLSIVFLYDVACDEEDVFLSSQMFCFELVIYINLLTELLSPNGLYSEGNGLYVHYKNWFLGYYNNLTKYFIPALMFAWLFLNRTGKRMRVVALTLAMALSAFLIGSGGVYLALFAMMFVYVFLKDRTRVLNYFTYWLLHIVFFLTVYVFRLQELFRWLIDDILGKWSSLTMRIFVWEQTAGLVRKSPILGYGVQSQLRRAAEVHRNHGIHAHNMLFEILYQSGGVGLCIWAVIVIVAGMRIYKYRNTEESKIISTAFLGWCVATLVEPFTTCFLMGMFIIAYHSNRALPDEEIVTERRRLKRLRFVHR